MSFTVAVDMRGDDDETGDVQIIVWRDLLLGVPGSSGARLWRPRACVNVERDHKYHRDETASRSVRRTCRARYPTCPCPEAFPKHTDEIKIAPGDLPAEFGRF